MVKIWPLKPAAPPSSRTTTALHGIPMTPAQLSGLESLESFGFMRPLAYWAYACCAMCSDSFEALSRTALVVGAAHESGEGGVHPASPSSSGIASRTCFFCLWRGWRNDVGVAADAHMWAAASVAGGQMRPPPARQRLAYRRTNRIAGLRAPPKRVSYIGSHLPQYHSVLIYITAIGESDSDESDSDDDRDLFLTTPTPIPMPSKPTLHGCSSRTTGELTLPLQKAIYRLAEITGVVTSPGYHHPEHYSESDHESKDGSSDVKAD